MSKKLQVAAVAVAGALLLAVVAGCGGGGAAPEEPPPPPTLLISTTSLPDGVFGAVPPESYNQTVAASGGTGARTFSISVGALPAGLSINASTGAITGTPTGPAGTASFTVQVVDSGSPQQTDTQALTIDINNDLLITTVTLPNATIDIPYNATVAATGGEEVPPGTQTFTFQGTLPTGLNTNAAGMITGTPSGTATTTLPGTPFTARVEDSSSPPQSDIQNLTITVTLEIATTTLPDATAGTAYNQTLQARGGLPPYVPWMLTGGSMPAGIADPVAATGVISGTPTAVCMATTSNFTAQVSDSAAAPQSDTQALSITVNPGPALNISTSSLPNGTVGVAYSATVQAVGGVPPYSFAVTTGMLPSMLMLTAGSGLISGTPDMAETQNFDITVTDFCGAMDTQALSITVGNVSLGRNDSIATATALSNGTFAASISPSGHPNTTLDPDEDFYEITGTVGNVVTISITAFELATPSRVDSVIELQDANGARILTGCRIQAPATFTSQCMNDDRVPGLTLDSRLEFQVDAAHTTFFVRVLEFTNTARPDQLYQITITGAN